jgi:putative glycerol-1-phosphate prenyltransferase
MIELVSQSVDIPIIIGGGICSPEKAIANCKAGADLIVVGNSIEKCPELLDEIAHSIHQYNSQSINGVLS